MSVFGWLGRALSGAAARRQDAPGDRAVLPHVVIQPPPPAGVELGARGLRVGSRGPDVGWLQQRLAGHLGPRPWASSDGSGAR